MPPSTVTTVRLFTLEGAVPDDPAVARWFSGPSDAPRATARRWFDEMRGAGPDVDELLHDGHPTACVSNLALGYVDAFATHVNVGFYFGAVLPDPSGLLQGTGRFMRHVKVVPGQFTQDAALRELMVAAYADLTARLPR